VLLGLGEESCQPVAPLVGANRRSEQEEVPALRAADLVVEFAWRVKARQSAAGAAQLMRGEEDPLVEQEAEDLARVAEVLAADVERLRFGESFADVLRGAGEVDAVWAWLCRLAALDARMLRPRSRR
jgi:hypothetical protein